MKTQWPLVLAAFFSLFSMGYADNVRGPLFHEILNFFSISDGQGAWFFAASSFMSFVGSLLAGVLLKYFHRIFILQIGLLNMTISLWGMGWAPQFWAMIFCAILFGTSIGLLSVIQNSLVTVGTPQVQKRRQLLSGLHAIYGVASLFSPLVVAIIYEKSFSWRSNFWIAGALCLLPFLYTFKGERPSPFLKREASSIKGSASHENGFSKKYVILGLSLGGYVLTELMVSTRLSLYLNREYDFSPSQASLYVTFFFVALLLGRLFFVFKDFSSSLKNILSTSLILTFFLLLFGIYVDPKFFIFSGFTMAPFYPLFVAYLSQVFETRFDTSLSTAMALQSVSVVGMHLGVGYLTDRMGLQNALLIGPLFLIGSLALLFYFEKNIRPKIRTSE